MKRGTSSGQTAWSVCGAPCHDCGTSVQGTCKFRQWNGGNWVPFPPLPGCTLGVAEAESIAPSDFFVIDYAGRIGHFRDGRWTIIDANDPGAKMTDTATGAENVAIDGYTTCSVEPRH